MLVSYMDRVSAVYAEIYSAVGCGGAPYASFNNVPNSLCYSYHGRASSDFLTPTSGYIHCNILNLTSSWQLQLYGLGTPTAVYDCTGIPFALVGIGEACVDTGVGYFAKVHCAVQANSLRVQSAGGVEAAIDQTEPFSIKIAPASGNITAGRYLKLSYSYLGELKAGSVVVDDTSQDPAVFHSIPLTDLIIAANLNLDTFETADYAFVGYVGPLPQRYSTDLQAAGLNLNFLIKTDAMIASYDVQFPGSVSTTTVCLRDSSNSGGPLTCTPFQVHPGSLKNAIGLFNWTYAMSSTSWRIQYQLQIEGLTGYSVYFNGDTANTPPFAGQVTSITWTSADAPFGFTFTYVVQQKFNKGDNTFGTATITSSGTAADLRLNVDLPLSSLAVPSGLNGWWLYDPDVIIATESATNNPGGGGSSGGGGGFTSAAVRVMQSTLCVIGIVCMLVVYL